MSVILGAGLSGLSAAYYLKQIPRFQRQDKLFIIEALNKCGGWIRSNPSKGYIFEIGPRTIRPVENTLKLIEDLDLGDLILPITANQPSAKNRMIFVNGELHSLPRSMLSMFTINKPFTKAPITALIHDLFTSSPVIHSEDVSIYDFVHRRFGEEVANYAISPLICGICAGDAHEISVKFLMKPFFEYEQKYGGVIKGMLRSLFVKKSGPKTYPSYLFSKSVTEKWSSFSFKGGLQVLPDTLLNKVLDDKCQLLSNIKVETLKFYTMKGKKKIHIRLSNGMNCVTKKLFSSLPAFELANLVRDDHPELGKFLNEIPFVTVAVVNLKFKSSDLLQQQGFGFLVPPAENLPILGVIFDSCCFPEQNNGTVLTVMMGGRWFEERCGKNASESELLKIALTNIELILGIHEKPEDYKVSILKNCIPQYTVGHYNRVKKIRDYILDKNLPLSVFGSSYDGVGVNDVILSARNAVDSKFNFSKYQ